MNLFNMLGAQPLAPILRFFEEIKTYINYFVIAFLAIIALGGIVFAIWVALKMVRAADEQKRKEAKNHLIFAIVGIIGAVLIFVLITTVFEGSFLSRNYKEIGENDAVAASVNMVLLLVSEIVNLVFSLITVGAMVLAVYVAWKLMSAADENKRKQAKAQMIWTIVAIFAVIVLNVLITEVMAMIGDKVKLTQGIRG